ncbi:MAG: V-type proton ATPase subunit E [Spirochaetes bacterium]|nr:V-type proton ATPase subunit E [Spirochaetota bacterium]
MKTSSDDMVELVSGIGESARHEAVNIIAAAEKTVADKQLAKDMRVAAIKKDTDKKIAQQVAVIERNNASAISVECRRIALKIKENTINDVINRIKEKIDEKANDPSYVEIIRSWILEAAIGLGKEEAIVNASQKELKIMTDDFLKETEKKYNILTGRNISLKKADKDPLFSQGIVLSSKDNKTAFNNQVPTRLMRYQSEVRKIIYKEFFS